MRLHDGRPRDHGHLPNRAGRADGCVHAAPPRSAARGLPGLPGTCRGSGLHRDLSRPGDGWNLPDRAKRTGRARLRAGASTGSLTRQRWNQATALELPTASTSADRCRLRPLGLKNSGWALDTNPAGLRRHPEVPDGNHRRDSRHRGSDPRTKRRFRPASRAAPIGPRWTLLAPGEGKGLPQRSVPAPLAALTHTGRVLAGLEWRVIPEHLVDWN
jgi:hypothetical protein